MNVDVAPPVARAPAPNKPGPIESIRTATIDAAVQRKEALKKGLRTEARHLDYLDVASGSEYVMVSAKIVKDVGPLFMQRREALKSLPSLQGPMAEIVKKAVGKWENAIKYFNNEAGAQKPEGEWALTKEDLDAGYYVVFDEMMQLGVYLGREVSYRPRFLGIFGSEAYVHPQGPSYKRQAGLANEHVRSKYGEHADPRQIEEDLIKYENTRREFIEALTGHRVNDRVMNRINWGTCTQSLFERGRTGLKLHDRILENLEGSADYKSVLQRYRTQTGRDIYTITDLLVNIDNPVDRELAVRLFHDAMTRAAEERFGKEGTAFVQAHITEKTEAWKTEGIVENAKQKIKNLESEGQLTGEQKTEFQELQSGIRKVREILEGRAVEGGNAAMPSLQARVTQLRDAVERHRAILGDPNNNTVVLSNDLNNARNLVTAYQGNGPVPLPADIVRIDTRITAANRLAGIIDRRVVIATYTQETKDKDMENNQRALDSLERQRADLFTKHREAAERQVTDLQTRLTTAQNARNAEKVPGEGQLSLKQAYDFLLNDIPRNRTDIQNLRDRLDRMVRPPPPPGGGAAPPVEPYVVPHVGRINQTIVELNSVLNYLNDMMNGGGGVNPITRGSGETWDQYVAGPPPAGGAARFNFAVDDGVIRGLVLPLEVEVRGFDEILRGRLNPEMRTRVDASNLVVAIVEGLPKIEASAGPPPVRERPAIPRILDEANKRIFADKEWGEILQALSQRHDLNVIRRILCDHAAISTDPRLRDTVLWQRVFNDRFVLQSAVEFFRELDLPPAAEQGTFFTNANNRSRQAFIEQMGSSRIRFGEFLTYLVEKRLNDVGYTPPQTLNVVEAQPPAAVGGNIRYVGQPRTGPAANIFGCEVTNAFWGRMGRERRTAERLGSRVWEVNNIGNVREVAGANVTTPEGRVIRSGRELEVNFPEGDPLVVNIGGQRRELPLRFRINRSRWGNFMRVNLEANSSLAGINIPALGGNYDRRWVDLIPAIQRITVGRGFANYAGFLAELQNLMPGLGAANIAQVGDAVSRSMGDWFLGRSGGFNRADFPRFPDIGIAVANYPNLGAQYDRISMDASGNLELRVAPGQPNAGVVRAIDSILETEQNNVVLDELLRVVGQQVFNNMGA